MDGFRSRHGHYLCDLAGHRFGTSEGGQEEEETGNRCGRSGRIQARVTFEGEIYSGSLGNGSIFQYLQAMTVLVPPEAMTFPFRLICLAPCWMCRTQSHLLRRGLGRTAQSISPSTWTSGQGSRPRGWTGCNSEHGDRHAAI